MEAKEIIKKPKKELQILLDNLRDKLRDLRFKTSADQLKNVREIRKVKKDIARVLTVMKSGKKEIESPKKQIKNGEKEKNK